MGIKGFLETTFIDWPGKIAAAVFLPGCNFRCPFCHNAELVVSAERLDDIPPEDVFRRIADLEWIDGLVVSGGEPTLHRDLPSLLEECSSRGLPVKLDTNGSSPGILSELIGRRLVAAVDMDVKAPLDGESYSLLAGREVNVEEITRSVNIIASSGLPHRFRTTVVPGMIGGEEVQRIAAALPPSSPLHLQAFDPRRTLDAGLGRTGKRPTGEEMEALRRLVSEAA